ncbi:hypothetical protein KP509_24G072300 [Ceratopteris richardii]|uniref:Uncharacterized protein n=1 Tax=Ceratopteris richardii TaxID=49495 RepID=A0A8T2RYZ2_CERRI|nr:hypothetical protein KP509_24G072300 [Ceratopteris richardii]
MRYGTNLSNGVCALVGPCDSECKRHSHSRSEKLDIASDTFKQMASLDSVPIDFLNLQLGTKQKEVKAEDPRLTECSCAFAEAISIHGDEKENTKEVLSESQIVIKTTSERNHVGKDADDDEESEPKFFDAFSRLNSIRSNASFYTVGSPKSQSDSLLWQNEWAANYQSYFVDASSQFETAQAFTIEKTPRVLCSQMEDASDASREPSSVSNRFGKALKLEICESMCNESPVYDGTHVLREGDPREGNFPGLQHAAFDGLYSLGVGVVSPIFPAKCQSGNTSLGWPLALSTYQASSVDGFDRINQEKQTEKCAFGLEVSSPPLPPSPRGAWLGKALARSAVKTSPLATLQQKDKLAATRKKLDSLLTDTNGESSWEEVVKGSQVEPGKLRFLEV